MGVFGYLDAGSGSMIVGAVAAGAAGVFVAAKVGLRRVGGVFSRKGGDLEAVAETPAPIPTATGADASTDEG